MNVPAMSKEQAGAAVKAAVAERDAIQANLLELDSSFGKQLLTGAELTGETRRRWDATAATLAILWQVYEAYSSVVDQAAEAVTRHLGPRGSPRSPRCSPGARCSWPRAPPRWPAATWPTPAVRT